jgi:hypothetical protein
MKVFEKNDFVEDPALRSQITPTLPSLNPTDSFDLVIQRGKFGSWWQ